MIAYLIEQGKGIVRTDSKGQVDTVLLQCPVEITTPAGVFLPCVSGSNSEGQTTRKKEAPLKFYPGGGLKSLPLEETAEIATSAGTISAELLTFYQSGSLKRVFPLNGKISGFWSEKDEYALVSEVSVDCYGRSLRIKPLYLQFYETGELESIALWPSDRLSFETPVGPLTVRNGIAFYKNGKLRSVEPSVPAAVSTGIGTLTAFHPDPDGVCAETASLSFSTSGEVTALSTSASTVEVTRADGTQKLYAPVQVKSMCSDLATAVAPLKICFADKAVVFGRGHTVIGSEPLSGSFSIGVYAPVMENSETCTDECLPDYSFRA